MLHTENNAAMYGQRGPSNSMIEEFIFKISGSEIVCRLDRDSHQPQVTCKKGHRRSTPTNLKELVDEIPELQRNEYMLQWAKIANFLLKGKDFQVIDNPAAFKKEYEEQIQRERDSFDQPAISLSLCGNYNLNEVSPPHLVKRDSGDVIVFYVQKSRIPYRVTYPYPVPSADATANYEVLPHK